MYLDLTITGPLVQPLIYFLSYTAISMYVGLSSLFRPLIVGHEHGLISVSRLKLLIPMYLSVAIQLFTYLKTTFVGPDGDLISVTSVYNHECTVRSGFYYLIFLIVTKPNTRLLLQIIHTYLQMSL